MYLRIKYSVCHHLILLDIVFGIALKLSYAYGLLFHPLHIKINSLRKVLKNAALRKILLFWLI